jgi:hypothetical protein
MAWVAGASSSSDVVAMGVGGAPMPCLLGEGPLKTMWNSSVESFVMARNGDSGSQRVEPMKAAFESFLLGERHMPLKKSAMNSRLLKWTVSLREKPPHVKRTPSPVTVSADEEIIRTSKGKACCKSPSWCQLLVFSAPTNYQVVKIVHPSFEVVLWTTKHTKIYPSSGPSLEIIALRPVVWYWTWIEVTRGQQRAQEVYLVKGGNGSLAPCQRVGGIL